MVFPVKFIFPFNQYKKVSIHSEDFPDYIDKNLFYCASANCFATKIDLEEGIYRYQFEADGVLIPDVFRTSNGGDAVLEIGSSLNNGIIFDFDKIFVKNNQLVFTIGLDINTWKTGWLTVQTLTGVQVVKGVSSFMEGSYDYLEFVVDCVSGTLLYVFFELHSDNKSQFYGKNGLQESEWKVEPFEIDGVVEESFAVSDITAVYNISNDAMIPYFEKRIAYFDKLPVDYIHGKIEKKSPLLQQFTYYDELSEDKVLSCLLRKIFLERDDIVPVVGLLGRFSYEYKRDIATIPFILSDENVSFWETCGRQVQLMLCAVGFQFLGSMIPRILFGEEIGLVNSKSQRTMVWTKIKWNKHIFQFYQKLLKLRKKYKVLRQGRFRFVIQDCYLLGIERYMKGEDSLYIFINLSKDNIVIDLTKIMNYSGPIIELMTDHPVKRKRVCTIFGEMVAVYKVNSNKNKTITLVNVEQEDDFE